MPSAPTRGGWAIGRHGLAAHLRDAIRLNRARRPEYVRLGGWRAGLASSLLIASERALLPSAYLLDRQARPFVAAGIPILVADLMPMDGVSDGNAEVANATPRSAAHRSAPPLSGAGGLLLGLRLGDVRLALKNDAFHEAADGLVDALRTVRDTEAETGRDYALTAHVVESAGLMALRAPVYAEASGGATVRLSRRLVAGHLPLVRAAVGLDRLAHPVQARGIPLFLRDLPAIPFEAEHAA